MNAADKRVPIFLVIAPAFTEESESKPSSSTQSISTETWCYHSDELKALADEWSAPQHKNRETPFPLGLLAASGRFDRRKLGKLTV